MTNSRREGSRTLDFDENLTSPARLKILACLIPGELLSFTELKKKSGLADGNLHVQCRKLESAGYIEVSRGQRGKRSWTRFRIAELGIAALKLHVRKLQAMIETETGSIRPTSLPRGGKDESQVWSKG